jgi:HSP20 family protein
LSEDKNKPAYDDGKDKTPDEEVKKSDEDNVPYASRAIQRDFNRLLNQFQRDFDDFWGVSSRLGRDVTSKARASIVPFTGLGVPYVDLEDQGKNYRLTAELPGFKKDDMTIEMTEDSITINAKKTHTEDQKNKNYVRHERSAQTYYRKIHLPEPVRSDDANANLKDGILEISLPKKAPKETKTLTIT